MNHRITLSRIDTARLVRQWSLDPINRQTRVKQIFSRIRGTRYPVKLLRYWFMYQMIAEEAVRLGRPLRICEIGVDRGQMIQFMRDAGFSGWACWDAIDVKPHPELASLGYGAIVQANAEDEAFRLTRRYDVVITLHLLEHLHRPETLVAKVAGALEPGGILIGGYPVTPALFAPFWERRLRACARAFRHVSVFSPERTIELAQRHGMSIDFLSGAFLMRNSGCHLENSPGWMRLNLAFGALFPSVGGELYWRMRRGT